MKAHIPAKKALSAPTKKAVREYVEEYERDCMRRFFKLACTALHEEFGFGKDRLARFILDTSRNAERKDELFWWHTDKLLIDQMGIQFDREEAG